tara:strand:- start:314 stop:1048 length:735 start_codon:yes stop_codon:yes gene_type:complete
MDTKYTNPSIAIAIDGPAGSGKGTLAKALAGHYKLKYLDTGTLYRATGFRVLRAMGDPGMEVDAIEAAQTLSSKNFDFRHVGNNEFGVFLDGEDVSHLLRRPEVSNAASKVSFFPPVRAALKSLQADYVKAWRKSKGVVLDGRDIGTVIIPNAEVKFYLEASAEERAKRRVADMQGKGLEVNYHETLADILERDARDMGRAVAPLKPADDAIIMDTTTMTIDQVVAKAIEHIDSYLDKHLSVSA